MSELSFTNSCLTYAKVNCEICNTATVPDDQEIIITGKRYMRYICVCMACKVALGKKKVCEVINA